MHNNNENMCFISKTSMKILSSHGHANIRGVGGGHGDSVGLPSDVSIRFHVFTEQINE